MNNTPEVRPKNIHQRLLAVMTKVSYIQKESKKVNNQYSFVSHDAVVNKLRQALIEEGIAFHPQIKNVTINGNRVELLATFTFVNVDDPSDSMAVDSFGFGIDPQDKGPGKAMSYAKKYALLNTFLLETGDDPERDTIEHVPSKEARPSTPTHEAPIQSSPPVDSLVETAEKILGTIDGGRAYLENVLKWIKPEEPMTTLSRPRLKMIVEQTAQLRAAINAQKK